MTSNTRKNVLPLGRNRPSLRGRPAVLARPGRDRPAEARPRPAGRRVGHAPARQSTARRRPTSRRRARPDEADHQKRVDTIGVGEPEVTVRARRSWCRSPASRTSSGRSTWSARPPSCGSGRSSQNLAPAPSKADEAKITTLRKKLKIPAGVSARTARRTTSSRPAAMPTIPDPTTTTTTTPDRDGARPRRPHRRPPTTTDCPGPAPAAADRPRSAKLAATGADHDGRRPTTSTTTTTIDPAPKNQYGIKVFKNKNGDRQQRPADALPARAGQGAVDLDDHQARGRQGRAPPSSSPARAGRRSDGTPLQARPDAADRSCRRGRPAPAVTRPASGWSTRCSRAARTASTCSTPPRPSATPATRSARRAGRSTAHWRSCWTARCISAPTINAGRRSPATRSRSRAASREDRRRTWPTALRFGSLPLELKAQQAETVSATLGEGALQAGDHRRRHRPGPGASLYIALLLPAPRARDHRGLTISGIVAVGDLLHRRTRGLTLTLAGIVGIVVSIGISLDWPSCSSRASRRTSATGRTLRISVDKSFSTAYATIVKADMSSLIGAVGPVLAVGRPGPGVRVLPRHRHDPRPRHRPTSSPGRPCRCWPGRSWVSARACSASRSTTFPSRRPTDAGSGRSLGPRSDDAADPSTSPTGGDELMGAPAKAHLPGLRTTSTSRRSGAGHCVCLDGAGRGLASARCSPVA